MLPTGDGKFAATGERNAWLDMERVYPPDRAAVEKYRKYHVLLNYMPAWTLETTRGCRHRCKSFSVWQSYEGSCSCHAARNVRADFEKVGRNLFIIDDLFRPGIGSAMVASWWDEAHWRLWRVADRTDLLGVVASARRVARETAAPLLSSEALFACGWTAEKAQLLASLDESGLTRILSTSNSDIAMPLALAAWELAYVDGGLATLSMSGSLAQMPIRDFGTKEQRERYLGQADMRHGALCLTEPIPGAGADAISLTGSFQLAGESPDGEPQLEIRKRGRFTSHMDFADFVLAAVEGLGSGVHGSCLAILEPGDRGEFDRGSPVRKLGHRVASTTNPAFSVRVPASRIVGGYTIDSGVLLPNFDHRRQLEPAFRRTRALLSVMTASKALSTIEALLNCRNRRIHDSQSWQRMADLWAAGEAAASLGFSAARLSDELDRSGNQTGALARAAGLFASAAKLFSTSQVLESLPRVAALGEGCPFACGNLHSKLIDAQIEAMYMGPEALQRRQVSAAMISGSFLAEFLAWIEEVDSLSERLPNAGTRSLAAGMRLWHWALDQMRHQSDGRGAKLYCDARQGVTFAMADALCGLLAARSLTLDLLELKRQSTWLDGDNSMIFSALTALASVCAAASAGQICAGLLFGYDGRFPVSDAGRRGFADLQANLNWSLYGVQTAREQVVRFLLAERPNC